MDEITMLQKQAELLSLKKQVAQIEFELMNSDADTQIADFNEKISAKQIEIDKIK